MSVCRERPDAANQHPASPDGDTALGKETLPWPGSQQPGSHPFSPAVNFPFPRNHSGQHHPSCSPSASAATAAWGALGPELEQEQEYLSPAPIASSHHTLCHLLWGHWAKSQPCQGAVCCWSRHRGARYRLAWASWHWVPQDPGIMALGTTGSWHHGAGHPRTAAHSILDRRSWCPYLRSPCRLIAGVPW